MTDYPNYTPYHYVHQNPINLIDPTGMSADPVYDVEGNHLGNTKEGFTGDIIIYSGDKDKSSFENLTAEEFIIQDNVFLLDDVINDVSDNALSKIFTNIAESFEGYNGFNMESIGGKVGYSEGEFYFLSTWTSGAGKGEIVGNRQYPNSYESTVENIGLTITNHEWSGHIMKEYGTRNNNHRKAYLEVLKDPMFDKTTSKFQEYNKRRYTDYLKLEMEQKKTK